MQLMPHIYPRCHIAPLFRPYHSIFASERILFLFLSLSTRSIQIPMSQEQPIQQQHLQSLQEAELNDQKVNPETLQADQNHNVIDKCVELHQEKLEIKEFDPKTPKRNKSQDKQALSQQKYASNKHSQSLSHSSITPKNRLKNTERILEEEEEPGHKHYEELTNKLELVLNKIAGNSKVINKSKSTSQREDLIFRFEEFQERKKKQIVKKKEEYEQLKIKELKEKPTIDRNSNKISKEIGHKPIYLRVDVMVEEKKKKLQRNQELRRQKMEEEEQSYIEEYNKHVKKPESRRTYDEYFSEMVRWKEKRQQENKQKLQIKKSKELEGITFQPMLNSKSKKMVSSHQRLPIQQRGLIKAKKLTESKIEEPRTYGSKKATPTQ